MIGGIALNIALLLATTVVIHGVAHRWKKHLLRDFFVGVAGAAAILAALVLFRRFFTIDQTDVIQQIGWIAVVVLVEEITKVIIVTPLRPYRSDVERRNRPRAYSTAGAAMRGWGFALTEHLLYLLISPGAFLLRLVLAGTIHVGSATYYAQPQSPAETKALVNIRRVAGVALIHLAFNITVTSLDALPVFW